METLRNLLHPGQWSLATGGFEQLCICGVCVCLVLYVLCCVVSVCVCGVMCVCGVWYGVCVWHVYVCGVRLWCVCGVYICLCCGVWVVGFLTYFCAGISRSAQYLSHKLRILFPVCHLPFFFKKLFIGNSGCFKCCQSLLRDFIVFLFLKLLKLGVKDMKVM